MLSFWNREAIEIEVVNMLEDYLGRVMYPLDVDALAAEMGFPSRLIAIREHTSDYPDLLTPAHIAEITGQCESTVRAMCSRAELPAVRIGKRWYVPSLRWSNWF